MKRWKQGQVLAYRERAQNRLGAPGAVREIVGSGLQDGPVESLYQGDRGRIWVATVGGVGYLENDRFVAIHGLAGGNVRSVAEDTESNLWINNQALGLLQWAPGKDVRRFSWATLGRRDFATALVADRGQGGLWLGFWDGGVAYFNDGQIRAVYAAAEGLGRGRVNSLQVDREGTLWVATEGGSAGGKTAVWPR